MKDENTIIIVSRQKVKAKPRSSREFTIVFFGIRDFPYLNLSGFGIFLIGNSGLEIESMHGRWDAKNNPRDYGIARNFGSGLRD